MIQTTINCGIPSVGENTLVETIIQIKHGYRLDGIVIESSDSHQFISMRIDEIAFEGKLYKEIKNQYVIAFTMPDEDVVIRIKSVKIPLNTVNSNEFGILPRLKGSGTVTVFDTEMTDGGCYICHSKVTVPVVIKPEPGYCIKNGSFRIVTKSQRSIYETHMSMYRLNDVNCLSFDFYMPNEDVEIYTEFEPETKRDLEDKFNMSEEKKYPDGVIDYFEIPEDLAKELSELLTKQVVRERLLMQVVSDPVRYEEIEKMIIPITAKVEAIKLKITNQYVPGKYRSSKYMWNYDGWEVDKNKVQILEQN